MCASGFQHPYSQEDLGSRLFQIGLEIDSWVNEEAESGVDPGLCVTGTVLGCKAVVFEAP